MNKNLGFVHSQIVEILLASRIKFEIRNKNIIFKEIGYEKLSKIFDNITELLFSKKVIKNLTGEKFPCTDFLGKKEYFNLDRSAVEVFGIRGYGVHLIAYLKSKEGILLWTPKRASNKRVEPNKYDNTIAGGIASKESVFQALKRESDEEAGIGSALLQKASSAGTISYNWRNNRYTLRRDTLFLFDLEVNHKFIPFCKDGEVKNFKLLNWRTILKKIRKTNSFKRNCALVIANFFIRKGLLTPRNEPNYEKICGLMNL